MDKNFTPLSFQQMCKIVGKNLGSTVLLSVHPMRGMPLLSVHPMRGMLVGGLLAAVEHT